MTTSSRTIAITCLAAALNACGWAERRPEEASLEAIKRQQEQRLVLECVERYGRGATGAVGMAVVQQCKELADSQVR